MAKSTTSELSAIVKQLRSERQAHADAIAAIDEQFEQHGITAEPRRKKRRGRRGPGRPKGSGKKKAKNGRRKKKGRKVTNKKAGRKKTAKKQATKKKRTRRSFSKTADQFILDLVKGRKGMTTGEINAKWRQARRGGTADNTLGKLVGDKKLKRVNIKGERGSVYTLAKRGSKKKTTKKKAAAKKSGKKSSAKRTSKKKSSKKKAVTKSKAAATPQQAT